MREPRIRAATTEPRAVRVALVSTALLLLGAFVVVPIATVFVQALSEGVARYGRAITDPLTLSALRLTLIAAGISVPCNTLFGLTASWAIAKFEFRGRTLLVALIDLPFTVSPVISGMVFVVLFGAQGFFGPFLLGHGVHVVFAVPGIVLATTFVTFPFVARELIPLMQAQGNDEEEAALTLGASGLRTFWSITLPKIKWGLLYGVVLCTARAVGEFGAVSVVSGHVRGETNTLPLHIEILYDDYDFAGAFAVASLLAMLGLVTLVAKRLVAARAEEEDTAR